MKAHSDANAKVTDTEAQGTNSLGPSSAGVSEMVLAIAKAIYVEIGWAQDDPWEAATFRRDQLGMGPYSRHQEDCIRAARAAILAMREPTEAMWRAGLCEAVQHPFDAPAKVTPIWAAMIDALVKETTDG